MNFFDFARYSRTCNNHIALNTTGREILIDDRYCGLFSSIGIDYTHHWYNLHPPLISLITSPGIIVNKDNDNRRSHFSL